MSELLIQEQKAIKLQVPLESDRIKNAIEETKVFFNQFKKSLDEISKNIKDVEKMFQDSGICVPYLNFLRKQVAPDSWDNLVTVEADYLAWKKDLNGNFRLMFCQVVPAELRKPEDEVLSIFDDFTKQTEEYYIRKSVPFIEAKSEIRYRYHKDLPQFLRAFAYYLDNNACPF